MKKILFTIIGIVIYISLFSQTEDTICQSFNLFIDSTNATLETYVYKNCESQELYMLAGANFIENDSTYHQSIDSLEINWVINDTLTIIGNPLIYNFNSSDINTIRYYAIDQMTCQSRTEQIFYQNYPNFDFSDVSLNDDTVNLGDTVYLSGITLNYLSYTDYSNPMYVPDYGDGLPFSDTLSVSGIGDTINNINDIPDICINIEHSYLGDLVIDITCPNGTNVTLEAQGGGGVNLGEPIEINFDTTYGIGWDYCWSTNPVYDEMKIEADSGAYTTLPPGSYKASDDLSNLIGCPINGDWILTITDNWSLDNGFIFNWGIENNNRDSQFSYYIFNNIENNNTVTPYTTGLNEYNLEIHQGTCVYDTVLNVFVQPTLFVNENTSENISVFPNPAKDILNINNLTHESTLYIYDLSGQILIINDLKEINNKVNISKLPKGIYFCKVLGNNNYNFKLLVD